MRKTILVLALAFLAFVAVASVTDPAARNNEGSDVEIAVLLFCAPLCRGAHVYGLSGVLLSPDGSSLSGVSRVSGVHLSILVQPVCRSQGAPASADPSSS